MPDEPITHGLSFDDYQLIDAVNQSTLKHGLPPGTMAHIKAAMDQPDEKESQWMRLGSVAHAGALEPMTMLDRYAVMPDYANDPENCDAKGQPSTSASTTWCKAAKAEFAAANDGRRIVPQQHYDAAKAMIHNLTRHERAMGFLSRGEPEVSVTVLHEPTGLLLKGRLDYVQWDKGQFADLKTGARAVDNAVGYLAQWHVHFQAAFYRRLLLLATGEVFAPNVVLLQQSKPHHCDAFELNPEDVDLLDAQIDPLLARFAECVESGVWPALDDRGPKMVTMPGWWANRHDTPLRLTMGGEPMGVGETDDSDGEDEQIVF